MPVRSVSRASFPCQESGAFEAAPLRNGAFSTAWGRRVRKLRMLRPFCPKFLFISLALLLALPPTRPCTHKKNPLRYVCFGPDSGRRAIRDILLMQGLYGAIRL